MAESMFTAISKIPLAGSSPEVKKQHEEVMETLKQAIVVQTLADYKLPAIGWNYGKILAVDGKTLMTAGANYAKYPYGDNFKDICDMEASYAKAGGTPTAWASRIAPREAIVHAKRFVYLDAQVVSLSFQRIENAWFKALAKIDEKFGLKDGAQWDGVVWPYDLISALATFMNNVEPKTEHGVLVKGALLLLSPSATHIGYEDLLKAKELRQRIRWFADRPVLESDEDYTKGFDAIKRLTKAGPMWNHCKVVCCDGKLLYVGSDNPYPNYDEEHGVWMDDKDAIDKWREEFWNPRWTAAWTDDMKEQGAFPPTMG